MPLNLETNYRRHLYDHYLSTHFGGIHHPSAASLERERRVWRDYFGPLLPANKAARIADLGCGYGSFLYFLHEEGYRNIADRKSTRLNSSHGSISYAVFCLKKKKKKKAILKHRTPTLRSLQDEK